jgi:GntR family transcriptional regulator/MocR family aminotransferase
LYLQVCDGYREAVAGGRLRPGQRIPSTRSLAAALGISRLPVLVAYEQLIAEGYFEARPGSGTFVSRELPSEARLLHRPEGTGPGRAGGRRIARRSSRLARPAAPWARGFGAFRLSEPALDHFPFPAWSRLLARHARTAAQYGSALGDLHLREELAAYLASARGVRCEADQVMIVSGSQQALEITARVLLDPGDRVWVEEPGYAGARGAIAMAGGRPVPVPIDGEGLVVARARRSGRRARAAVVTPSHQYPLGVTMSAARRLQLLEWAREAGAWIVEDDYDSEYRYDSQPIAALQGIDRDQRVIYLGSFSKVLFPGLRVGYVVVPRDLTAPFIAVREAMDIQPPALLSAALADLIAEGHFARHVRRTSQLYRERRRVLVECLRDLGPSWEVVGAEAGIHLVVLCGRRPDRPLALRAAQAGLHVMPLSSCYAGPPTRQGLVLGYGGTPTHDIPGAVAKLRSVVEA